MTTTLVVSAVLGQATALHRLAGVVGSLFLVVWLVSFPIGAFALFLQKRKGTEEYTWPLLLLIASSFLLALAFLGGRTMIL